MLGAERSDRNYRDVESLEMAGVIVFIYALLKYIADNYEEVRFRFDDFEGNSRSKAPKT